MASCDFYDLDGVVSGFRLHNHPYFSLWQGKELKGVNNDDNDTVANEILMDHLKFIKKSGSTALFTLRVHDEPNINSQTKYIGSLNFRLTDSDNSTMPLKRAANDFVVINQDPAANETNQKLDKLIQLMELQLATRSVGNAEEISEEYDEEYDEDEDLSEDELRAQSEQRVERIVTTVSKIIEQAQPVVGKLIDMFGFKFGGSDAAPAPAVSGTDPRDINQKITESIDKLAHTLGPEKLANSLVKLSEMSPEKLNSLLQWL